ncbi:UNVERIFIED_CONTAM: hypothetical protein PYX00_011043 [Menopon gallinae]|uniref:tRNA methyltransferase TRMD/TRM10-type domain-containing protein n=1 Tax=Menopon gallinae TaxID=328185 RepID=A0AAW2H6Q8_9NEOP
MRERDEKELVKYIAQALVDNPEVVQVNVVEGEKSTILELKVAPSDVGKVIGKHGRIAKAIKEVMLLAKLGSAWGTQGYIKASSESGDVGNLLRLRKVLVGFVKEKACLYEISKALVKGDKVLFKFNGFDFPEEASLMKKAVQKGIVQYQVLDIRDFALDKHKSCDDEPYGGGAGMVMLAEPVARAIKSLVQPRGKVIFASPGGKPFTQEKARQLSQEQSLVFICGRYEGLDQRILDLYVDEELSIGDYVISSGEIASLVLIDGIYRLLDGVIKARGAFSSCLKVRVMVVRGQEGLALKLLDASPVFPSFLELTTRGLPLKPGQVLEVVLACVKDKWGGPLLSDNELLLAKLNLAPKGREASILDKFFTASLWAKRLLVMGILNKKTPAELALLNAYAFLQAPQPNTKELSDLLKTPLKAKQVKGSSLYWFIMPFECLLANKVLELAEELGVSVVCHSHLLESLWITKEGEAVQEELFGILAEVLAFVYAHEEEA